MKTLAQLINEYDGNGFVMLDGGNGSSGPSWIEWDAEAACKYGDIAMYEHDINDFPHDLSNDTIGQIINMVIDYDQDADTAYMSEVIIQGDGDNPWRFVALF